MIVRLRVRVAVAIFAFAATAAAQGNLELPAQQRIVVSTDTPVTRGAIVVRNSGDAAIKPALSTGTFFGDPGKEPLPITITFPPATQILAGATVSIPVELSNFSDFGHATVELRHGQTPLGTLRVVKKAFAFNVAPAGYDGKQPLAVHLPYGERASLPLVNSDTFAHSLNWSLMEGSREFARGRVPLLRPGSTVHIDIPRQPASLLHRFEGTLLSPQSAGSLLLQAVPGDPARIGEYAVTKEIPLQLRRTAGPGASRDLKQTFWILVLLLAGGLTSLFLTYWVPNALKKIDVRRQIEDLSSKIRQLRRTASTLRVLLSVERNQLRSRLDSRNVLSLEFAALAADCKQRAAELQRRIELTQKIEHLLIDIEREWERGTTLGPTILRRAEALLHDAAARLEQGVSEEDLHFAEAQVQQVAQSFRPAAVDPQRVGELIVRAGELQKRKAELQPLAGTLSHLAYALDVSNSAAVREPADVWKLDYAVTKLEVAAGAPAGERDKLLDHLKLHTLHAFEEAILQARLMREGTAVTDQVKAALADKRVNIQFSPEHPEVHCLVTFELRMADPGLNDFAAKRTYTCHWSFGDEYHEEGWRVSHYFARSGEFTVTATIKDRQGKVISENPIDVSVIKTKDKLVGTRTQIELIRLGVALFVVLLSLVAGAEEQLAKLDFVAALVALFLLGVTADQIKNLLAPRPDK